MGAQQMEAAAHAFADAFNRLDIPAAVELLDEDLEVFDHVPYRFDNKKTVCEFSTRRCERVGVEQFWFSSAFLPRSSHLLLYESILAYLLLRAAVVAQNTCTTQPFSGA
jgi:hypothetical protein